MKLNAGDLVSRDAVPDSAMDWNGDLWVVVYGADNDANYHNTVEIVCIRSPNWKFEDGTKWCQVGNFDCMCINRLTLIHRATYEPSFSQ